MNKLSTKAKIIGVVALVALLAVPLGIVFAETPGNTLDGAKPLDEVDEGVYARVEVDETLTLEAPGEEGTAEVEEREWGELPQLRRFCETRIVRVYEKSETKWLAILRLPRAELFQAVGMPPRECRLGNLMTYFHLWVEVVTPGAAAWADLATPTESVSVPDEESVLARLAQKTERGELTFEYLIYALGKTRCYVVSGIQPELHSAIRWDAKMFGEVRSDVLTLHDGTTIILSYGSWVGVAAPGAQHVSATEASIPLSLLTVTSRLTGPISNVVHRWGSHTTSVWASAMLHHAPPGAYTVFGSHAWSCPIWGISETRQSSYHMPEPPYWPVYVPGN